MSHFEPNNNVSKRGNKGRDNSSAKPKLARSRSKKSKQVFQLERLEGRRLLSALLPSQVKQAYGIDQIMYGSTAGNGAGQTVAIIDPGDDSAFVNTGSANFNSSDLYQFDNYSGVNLPNPPSFTVVGETGGARPSYPGIVTATESGTTVTVNTTSSDGLIAGTYMIIAGAGVSGYNGQYYILSTPTATTFTCTSTATMPATGLASSTGGTINPVSTSETALDVDWTHAIAPGANILLIEMTGDYNDSDVINAVGTAVSRGASVVSMSFSRGEYGSETGTSITSYDDGIFDHSGMTFVASTGDNGQPGGYPAYSPNVLAVGGTNLYLNSDNSYNSETGWSNPLVVGGNNGGSGGGISQYEPKPAYQNGTVTDVTQSSTKRTIPDISFDANTNVLIYDSIRGGAYGEGGTSLSAPCWAGLAAIADQGAVLAGKPLLNSAATGFAGQTTIQTALYDSPLSDFHDITSGYNGNYAANGYDLVTGIGTPVANLLVPNLAFFTGFTSSNFVVTNTNDSGTGSLRQAILDADFDGQSQTISFNIPTTDPNYSNGVFTISPQSALPAITDPGVQIACYTEPNSTTSNGDRPVIYLNGGGKSFAGLTLEAANATVANLGVENFAGTAASDGGILLTGNATGAVIKGCYIGIAPNGTSSDGNGIGISTVGELIGGNTINAGNSQTANNVIGFNTIGILLADTDDTVDLAYVGVTAPIGSSSGGAAVPNGTGIEITGNSNTVESTNIADNTGNGILMTGGGAAHNLIEGSTIGVFYEPQSTNPLYGYYPAANGNDGILINGGAGNEQIGGNTATSSVYPNLIAGNTNNGIEISASVGNIIESNTVGLATHEGSQNNAVNDPNGENGILIENTSTSNFIGGPLSTEGNTITGNTGDGVEIADAASSLNYIGYNDIGTNASGGTISNGQSGLAITGNSETIQYNVISGNGSGIGVTGNSNQILNNMIGTNPAGTAALGNVLGGITISGSSNTVSDDVISGNGFYGVVITGSSNTVVLSTIGLNAAGTAAVPNSGGGIYIDGANNTIGGTSFASAGNVISGNTASTGFFSGPGAGIEVDTAAAFADTIEGNYIGSNSAGNAALGNVNGILIQNGSNNNGIGGFSSSDGNLIGGNSNDGILINGAAGNGIYGNTIGVYNYSPQFSTSGGYYALANGLNGIQITNGADNNDIGISTVYTSDQNLIAGNGGSGIEIDGSSGNLIESNTIGYATNHYVLNGSHTVYNPNLFQGVYIDYASTDNTVGGTVSTEANTIAGNDGNGVLIEGSHNVVDGNFLGTIDAGTVTAGNGYAGVWAAGGNNTISGDVISGNAEFGLLISGSGSAVTLCTIGLNAAGTAALPNVVAGIYIDSTGNMIGGSSFASAGNVISGNTGGTGPEYSGPGAAIELDTTSASGNYIQGNYIGTNAAGAAAVGNVDGVYIQNGATGNYIGNASSGVGNVISGNTNDGVYIAVSAGINNVVTANDIGTNAAGTAAVPNSYAGVEVDAPSQTIGGTTALARNIISGNSGAVGVLISGSSTTLEGNYIGTNPAGTAALPDEVGVQVNDGSAKNIVVLNNLVSGNAFYGIYAVGNNSTSTLTVQGNFIGTDYTGVNAVGNYIGVYVNGDGTLIGGPNAGQGNTIDFNSGGIAVNVGNGGSPATAIPIIEGSTLYDNSGYGIFSEGGANATVSVINCTIAGTSGSGSAGVLDQGTSLLVIDDSTIVGNVIGVDQTGSSYPALENTIVAQDTSHDVSGTVSGSYDLIGNGAGMSGISNGVNHNQVGTAAAPINPLLGSLANNGGGTLTFLPASNSPAINTGIGISAISTDQRGDPRPTSGAVDIGSVQLQAIPVSISGAAIYLRLAGSGSPTLDVYYNNTGTGTPAATYTLANLSGLTVTGAASGANQLTIDYSDGVPIPSSGFSYGGMGTGNTLKVIGTTGNDTIGFYTTDITVNSSTAPYTNVQNFIVDPLAGADSLTITSGLKVSVPAAPAGGGILTRNFSMLTLGTSSELVIPTAAAHSDRTLLEIQDLVMPTGATTGGTIDLGGNDADITSGTTFGHLSSWIQSGYNSGLWNGTGFASAAAASSSTHINALAMIQNSEGIATVFNSARLFDGIVPAATDVLIKFTYYGDANLDGQVNGTDYTRIDNGFSSKLTGWYNGDFNYDNAINGSDYALIDNSFNTQASPLATIVTPKGVAVPADSVSSPNATAGGSRTAVTLPPGINTSTSGSLKSDADALVLRATVRSAAAPLFSSQPIEDPIVDSPAQITRRRTSEVHLEADSLGQWPLRVFDQQFQQG